MDNGGDSAQVKKNFDVLYAAAKWTHEAAPGHIVGSYGVIGHTDQAYIGLAKQLATRSDAFFPSLYTLFGTNTVPWTNLLKADVAQARKLDPRNPVFVYLWPQYHDGTPKALQFLPAKQWAYELDAAYRYADGFVIWSGSMTPTVPAAGDRPLHEGTPQPLSRLPSNPAASVALAKPHDESRNFPCSIDHKARPS